MPVPTGKDYDCCVSGLFQAAVVPFDGDVGKVIKTLAAADSRDGSFVG